MKYVWIVVCLFCVLAYPLKGNDKLKESAKLKVLFIGNSQMMRCKLPTMISAMADSAPTDFPRLEIGQDLTGGALLKTRWVPAVCDLIATGKWTYVVIQELYSAKQENFEPYALLFDEAIRKAGAKTILFATASVTESYSVSFSYPASTKALNDMQIAFGRKQNIPVAAAGYAWMRYLGDHPSDAQVLDLYDADKGHPGLKGSYIYACLLYAVITGKSPLGLTSMFTEDIQRETIISKDEATKMQQAAWEQYMEDSTR